MIQLIVLLVLSTATFGHQVPSRRILNGETSGYVAHAARVTGFSVAYSTEGSGTFVSQRHVVTSGRIIDNMSIFQVYHGNNSMAYAKALSGLGYAHPLFDPVTFENDIGIIVLGSPPAQGE